MMRLVIYNTQVATNIRKPLAAANIRKHHFLISIYKQQKATTTNIYTHQAVTNIPKQKTSITTHGRKATAGICKRHATPNIHEEQAEEGDGGHQARGAGLIKQQAEAGVGEQATVSKQLARMSLHPLLVDVFRTLQICIPMRVASEGEKERESFP